MKFFSIALTAIFVGFANAAPLIIDTPYCLVVAGKSTLIEINAANEPSAAPLEDLGIQKGTSFTWDTNLAAGTVIEFEIRDNTGAVAQSGSVVVE
ncbi:hypothetical protein CPB84DRAFT_1781941 [Gymnopilus junonius]|uniref:Uncharacterized protein n=1 Tax=Gymnopilus junonius TaxID=109634 RepID=A0A9P5NM83_GYMJU|nr:hypothetical protein CPB84DRAFT_1781941 [Gymnopilus junonius]